MTNKLSCNFVKQSFEEEGYTLLDNEYKDCKHKLLFRCPNNHVHCITFDMWKQGHRCAYCDGQGKPTITQIKRLFESEGYHLLTKEYINCKQKLKYVCSNGHKHFISWTKWRTGRRCPMCAKNIKLSIELVMREFNKEGYKLLNKKYINAHGKLYYVCPNGHERSTTWNDWRSGCRCRSCYVMNNVGANHPNWKGGISCEPYCDAWADKKYKESIKERDNYECQNPACWKKIEKLCVHHINYDKKNCHPSNLITLCMSCNSRANINRGYYTVLYREILIERGLYDRKIFEQSTQ